MAQVKGSSDDAMCKCEIVRVIKGGYNCIMSSAGFHNRSSESPQSRLLVVPVVLIHIASRILLLLKNGSD